MPLPFLRPDLPAAYSFSVSEKPHQAKLDQNEAPHDVPPELKRVIAGELVARAWNRYVQPPEYAAAKRALAGLFGLAPENIAITVGADQAIEAAFLVGGGPGRRARWFEPCYPYIAHAAMRTSTIADPVKLGRDVDAAITAELIDADPPADLIALVAPNNPTGGMPADPIIEAALADPKRMVLLDEAYADFSRRSHLGWLERHQNLVVVRSLSKSLLAGVHVGFVAAHAQVIASIERMYTAPYNLDVVQVLVAKHYPALAPKVAEVAELVIGERDRVFGALAAIDGITPVPSHANFVLFEVAGPAERASGLHAALADAGVRIRDVAGLHGMAGHLRVTIGTPAENDCFLEALARVVDPPADRC